MLHTPHAFADAEQILREALGDEAGFRDGQLEAINAVVHQRQRLIVVQRTGWGKSLVYFIATRLNRQINRGLTILVSPLLSLMRNQISQAERYGINAARIDSSNSPEHNQIISAVLEDKIDLLLISPERLANRAFRRSVWEKIRNHVGMLVIDEVHCLSDWGHDFRPDYRRVMHILDELPSSTPVLGTTATANSRVIEDIKAILGGDVRVSRGPLMRSSLRLYSFPEPQSSAYRLVLLSHLLSKIEGTGIIYCTTTRDCEIVAKWLQSEGFPVESYHSNVANRETLEEKLLRNEVKALAASVALGMGFDKPDLSFVIHYQLPGSIIGYYQQIGRAGRGIDNAHIILMRGVEDRDIQEYFIRSAFPPVQIVTQAAKQFTTGKSVTIRDLQIQYNITQNSAEKILHHLEVDGYLVSTGDGYQRTGRPIPDFTRWERVTQKRYEELDEMEAFASTSTCQMKFLAKALEDTTQLDDCGKCMNCRGHKSKFAATEHDVSRAQRFLLKGNPIWIDPRKQWSAKGVVTEERTLRHLNERGLALSHYGDDGWGKRVKSGKYEVNRFDNDLVQASADLIREHWNGRLKWVTCVPSTRHLRLVPDFARRLAFALELHYIEAVICAHAYPEQKTMQNSYLQLQNIADAFYVSPNLPAGPVLLVDDIVDSGWSLTLVGWHLRERGVQRVFPFALAKAMGKFGV